MWSDISKPWQEALKMAWEAYKKGTIPIGCVIMNKQGEVVSRGRNRIFDKGSNNPLAGCNMAHAEMTAMLGMSEEDHPEMRTYDLYTTTEPCSMCFGTMVMMNIRNIYYGARDTFGGATSLNDKLEYISSKKIKIHHEAGDIQRFQLILLTAFECERAHPRCEEMLGLWSQVDGEAIEHGRKLFASNYFREAMEQGKTLEQVYDEII